MGQMRGQTAGLGRLPHFQKEDEDDAFYWHMTGMVKKSAPPTAYTTTHHEDNTP